MKLKFYVKVIVMMFIPYTMNKQTNEYPKTYVEGE